MSVNRLILFESMSAEIQIKRRVKRILNVTRQVMTERGEKTRNKSLCHLFIKFQRLVRYRKSGETVNHDNMDTTIFADFFINSHSGLLKYTTALNKVNEVINYLFYFYEYRLSL